MSQWSDLPSFDEVQELLKRRASISAEIRMLELRLQWKEAEISVEKPRNTSVRIIGYDDETREFMLTMREALATKRGELDVLDAELKLLDYRKDIFRALAYRERI